MSITSLIQQCVKSESTDSKTAAEQVNLLGKENSRPRVVVADSLYSNQVFLTAFLVLKNVFALVRLRSTTNLCEEPKPKASASRGALRKHDATFKMKAPSREPDRMETFFLGFQKIRLSDWHKIHFRKLPQLIGLALPVEFLKADDTLRYQCPMWLFWTGPETTALQTCVGCICGVLQLNMLSAS